MELICLSRADVGGLGMTMREVLDVLDRGFAAKGRGQTEMPPKPGIHPRPDCFIHAMPAHVRKDEVAGVKWVSGFPPNKDKGIPYISGLVVLNDGDTGFPLAVMDCAWITAMRTGAETVASVGCGVQARTSLRALVEELPALAEVRCYDIDPAANGRFIADMAGLFPELRFVTCPSASAALRPADVTVTAMRECDRFFSDDTGQLLATRDHGVCSAGIPDEVTADLGELAAGLKPGAGVKLPL